MAFRRKPDSQDEYHRKFADAVIEQIRKGTAPWQKPWGPGESYRPANAVTGRPYTGGNSLYLNMRGEQRGFGDNRWATYKQIKAAGGQVRKGERGEQVLFFDNKRRIAVTDAEGKPKKVEGKQVYQTVKRDVPFIKTFAVFNAEQADGLKLERQGGRKVPLWQTHQAAEVVIEESKVSVRHVEGDRAFYSIKSDSITLPERAQFPSANHYYQTALHELGHSTGHKKRMDRKSLKQGMDDGFGSPAYAREELRAEISAMMTGEKVGVGHDPARGAAYVEAWVSALEDDPREIHRAAGEAERMTEHLMKDARKRIVALEKQHQDKAQELAAPRARALTPSKTRAPEPPTHDRSAASMSR